MPMFLWILVAHWVADFVCQTHWQASNKSKNNDALLAHVGNYTVVMALLVGILHLVYPSSRNYPLVGIGCAFVVLTLASHFATDYVTSRITSRLYARGDYHNFFVVVGFDQLVHYFTLWATLRWLGYPV